MELHFNTYGDGPPLVILHGFLGSSGNWHSLSKHSFGHLFTVDALDLRNHGQSNHESVHTIEAMAADVLQHLDRRKYETAALLGHSMGGKVAMRLALDHSNRVEDLVVVDIAPKVYRGVHVGLLDAMNRIDLASFKRRSEVDDALAPDIPSPAVRNFLLKNLMYGPDRRYAWRMNLPVLRQTYPNINRAVESNHPFEKPVLFVRGEKSDYILDEDAAMIRRLFPRAEISTISGAGHWVNAEAPAEFASIVTEFLTSD